MVVNKSCNTGHDGSKKSKVVQRDIVLYKNEGQIIKASWF